MTFTPNYLRLLDITKTVYIQMLADDDRLNRKLPFEMLNYYVTELLCSRLLDIKAKRAHTVLSEVEPDYRFYFNNRQFNIPQLIYMYVRVMGNIIDKRGK